MAHLSIYLCWFIYIWFYSYLSIRAFSHLSIYVGSYVFDSIHIYLLESFHIYLSIYLSVYLSIYLSQYSNMIACLSLPSLSLTYSFSLPLTHNLPPLSLYIWFVLWHINHCRLFYAKSGLCIYIYIYIYIYIRYMICKHFSSIRF